METELRNITLRRLTLFWDKVKRLIDTKAAKDPDAVEGNMAIFDNAGNPVDSGKPFPFTYSDLYLTFEALEDGTFNFLPYNNNDIYYSKDGKNWTKGNSVSVSVGDKVMWKGEMTPLGQDSGGGIGTFGGKTPVTTISFKAYGNIMSLLHGDDFVDNNTLVGTFTFNGLFRSNKLTEAHNLILPSTTLVDHCYWKMFYQCKQLISMPNLPATTLAGNCYGMMFMECSVLTDNIPSELPVTTLADSCYVNMFNKCTSLVVAPKLPATTLANSCYASMFQGCSNLEVAPELPAPTLAYQCYWHMFDECSKLNFIKCLATDKSASNCCAAWVKNVAANGIFIKANNTTWEVGGAGTGPGVPSGWNVYSESEWEVVRHYELGSYYTKPNGGIPMTDLSEEVLEAISSGGGGGEENVIESIKVNNVELTITSKTVNISVPTKVSELDNDSGFLTEHLDISGKQDVIDDLDNIRSGAELGATALQEHQDISGKADKVQNATANNVALLDANGNCIDSGKAFTPQGIGALPSDTTVTNGQNILISGGQYPVKTGHGRYILLMTYDEYYLLPITAYNNNTGTNKVLTDLDFDPFGQVYYYGVTAPRQADETPSTLYTQTNTFYIDLRYSFNMQSQMERRKAVYLVMVPQSNGRCKLHTSPYTQTLPTTEDGLVYKRIGVASSANSVWSMFLEQYKPCYYYKDGQIREWTNNRDKQDLLVSGTNIKTINNVDLLGSGNISISGGTPLHLKILVIGNSYSYDSFMYVPFILQNYGITIEIGIYYRGGSLIADLEYEFSTPGTTTESHVYTYINTETDTSWRNPEAYSCPEYAVKKTDWDIIVLLKCNTISNDDNTRAKDYRRTGMLIEKIIEASKQRDIALGRTPKPFRIGFNINIDKYETLTLMGWTHAEVMRKVLNLSKAICDTWGIDLVFPYGTAIFDARTNSTLDAIGAGGHLWYSDNTHLQQGVPGYIAGLAIVLKLFEQFYPQYSVLGDTLELSTANDTSWNVPLTHGSCITITDEIRELAQRCAIVANKYPFEIKTIYSIPSDYTAAQSIPYNESDY